MSFGGHAAERPRQPDCGCSGASLAAALCAFLDDPAQYQNNSGIMAESHRWPGTAGRSQCQRAAIEAVAAAGPSQARHCHAGAPGIGRGPIRERLRETTFRDDGVQGRGSSRTSRNKPRWSSQDSKYPGQPPVGSTPSWSISTGTSGPLASNNSRPVGEGIGGRTARTGSAEVGFGHARFLEAEPVADATTQSYAYRFRISRTGCARIGRGR